MRITDKWLHVPSQVHVHCPHKIRPTKRAADKWDAPRFSNIFSALGFSRFDGASTRRPLAANAPR